MSLFDLWDGRDKLAGRLADGTPYRCVSPDEPCEAPNCACDEAARSVCLECGARVAEGCEHWPAGSEWRA